MKIQYKRLRWRRENQCRRWIRVTSTLKLSSPILPPKWRMTSRRVWGNSLRPVEFRLKRFTPLQYSQGSAALKEVRQVGDQTTLLGVEKGASQDSRGILSNKCQHFLMIFNDILTVGELAVEWKASWLASPSPRIPPRRSWRGVWKNHNSCLCRGSLALIEPWKKWRLLAATLRKTKITKCPNYNCFFIGVVLVRRKHTLYVHL